MIYLIIDENLFIVASSDRKPDEEYLNKYNYRAYGIKDDEYDAEMIGKKLDYDDIEDLMDGALIVEEL